MSPASPLRLVLPLLAFAACSRPAPTPAEPEHGHDAPTNRIDVPATVRRNLGIEFVRAERRAVRATLRLPGRFELLPQARHEHRAPLAGRIDVRTAPLQPVEPGTLLYTIDAPDWRATQRELGEIDAALEVTAARLASMQPLLAAHKVHELSLHDAARVMEGRVRELEATRASVGGQAQAIADASVQLAQVRAQAAEAAEKHTETEALLAQLEADQRTGRERFQLLLAGAAATIGVDVPTLLTKGERDLPRWRTIDRLEVRARAAGIVDALPLPSGSWAADHELVATVVDPTRVRCRARALQSDLPRLRTGLPAAIVPPGTGGAASGLAGTLQLGAEADPAQRTIDVFVTPATTASFARAGVAAFVEVEAEGGGPAELAVPLAAIMQDGLAHVLFRRDPADPDKVIRIDGDLGRDDGRWIEVKSGLVDGDEVVVAGAYELMLASSGSATKGGHFHADGTFHADDHK
ncbi:MAG: hypothetical protein JNK78_15445 [Planctomycetes bacterium]|nr:hypothetical protein [Planctomycetota bacterium]